MPIHDDSHVLPLLLRRTWNRWPNWTPTYPAPANRFDNLVTLHCAAAGRLSPAHPGSVEVVQHVFGPGSTKVELKSDEGFTVVKKETMPLLQVSAVLPTDMPVRVAKLDVEGFEGVVLEVRCMCPVFFSCARVQRINPLSPRPACMICTTSADRNC